MGFWSLISKCYSIHTFFHYGKIIWENQSYGQHCPILIIQVKAAFKTHFNRIPGMLLPWRQQASEDGFKRRMQEETLRALFYMQSCPLTLFYAALLQFLIIQVQNGNNFDNSSVQKVRQLLTMLLVFSLFLIRGCKRAGEVSLWVPTENTLDTKYVLILINSDISIF